MVTNPSNEGPERAPTIATRSDDSELDRFIRRCQEGLGHQVHGESAPFLACWSHADDVAILGAVGSYARGWESVKSHLLGAAKRLNWTGLAVQSIVTIVGDGLAVSVGLEHMTRAVVGESNERTLRTTQVYRFEAGQWRLILRHANLVTAQDESLEQSLALTP